MRSFKKKKVVVVGLGVSGLWLARWLAGQGADVTVSEKKPENDLDPDICADIRKLGSKLETGGHRKDSLLNAEMVIVSPGVPHDMEPLNAALKKGIPVTGEFEFASRIIDTPVIAVTGTNGKSTVVAFLGNVLENAGLKVFVGGNIGTPMMVYAAGERKADYVVAEVSSFQLDTMETFCPYISMILNLSPDHLDRYADYESYVQSKLRIFRNQGPGQYLVLNDDDKILSSISPASGVSVLRYGIRKKEGRHAFLETKKVQASLNGKDPVYFSLESIKLHGEHNRENILGAVLVCLTLGIEPDVIQKSIDDFKGLPSRLEQVAEVDGVMFYNDSKATNIAAAVKAVKSFDQPLILISGGRHKGADYAPLVKAAEGKVKCAVLLGEAKQLLAASFEGVFPFSMAKDMEEAVSMSFSFAKRGDVVLLAPACSSFDMFSNFLERGKVFRDAVERLGYG